MYMQRNKFPWGKDLQVKGKVFKEKDLGMVK